MAASNDTRSMAVFCDFENVALGVREAKYDKFDISKVLERLLVKGSIVVKRAYCDWERYKEFKGTMHEAAFELIEIPHVRMSGKNSADIRMVVDALDLCYTKEHVDTFVIVSGDSDFSPLVSKLRENNKEVIGVGVKKSSSDLLINNCDEFIYYDDLVREEKAKAKRTRKKPAAKPKPAAAKAAPEPDEPEVEDKTQQVLDLVGRDLRGAGGRARRRREDLGLDDQAGAQAPQAGLQRILLRVQELHGRAGGSEGARPARPRARREVGRVPGARRQPACGADGLTEPLHPTASCRAARATPPREQR